MTVQVGEASTSMPACSPQGPRTRRQKRLAEEGSDCLAVTTKEVTITSRARDLAAPIAAWLAIVKRAFYCQACILTSGLPTDP